MTDIQIVLYGNSLFMAGVEASLKSRDGLDVIRVDATLPGAVSQLNALGPHAIVFDLAAATAEFVLPFLKEHFGLPLIGLDVSSNSVIVLCSQQHTALTVNDLAHVIEEQVAESSSLVRSAPPPTRA